MAFVVVENAVGPTSIIINNKGDDNFGAVEPLWVQRVLHIIGKAFW
jgi:hypothetical protein